MMVDRIKRFYRRVETSEDGAGGFHVLLDGSPVRSPGKRILSLPNEKMARVLTGEFGAQEEYIESATMPAWRFAGMAVDAILPRPEPAREEIMKYAASDLLCYRAASPMELAQRQRDAWDGILQRFEKEAGSAFLVTDAISYIEQDRISLDYVAGEIEKSQGFELAALFSITNLTGSALLALALRQGWISDEEAWRVAHIDEDWQTEQWGEDEDARARRQYRRTEYEAAMLALD